MQQESQEMFNTEKTWEWNKFAKLYQLWFPILESHMMRECIKNSEKPYWGKKKANKTLLHGQM